MRSVFRTFYPGLQVTLQSFDELTVHVVYDGDVCFNRLHDPARLFNAPSSARSHERGDVFVFQLIAGREEKDIIAAHEKFALQLLRFL